jgi:group I intron endonuclease
MLINRALLKYGYSNFKLEILEYCEACDLLAREQHFIITILPEYNTFQTALAAQDAWDCFAAGSSLGFKHSEETKQKISDALIGSKLSNETKKKSLML